MTKRFKQLMAVTLSLTVLTMYTGHASALMVPTSAAMTSAVSQRTTDMKTVQTFLEQKQVQEQLASYGFTNQEINNRLENLSDKDLHQVATHIDKEHPAADGGGLVITVLLIGILVLLFVYLAKRV